MGKAAEIVHALMHRAFGFRGGLSEYICEEEVI